jgi:tRNA nucleotidyltransferase/poly(A) polymerase
MFTIRAKFPSDHKFAKLDADFVMARKEVGYVKGTRRPILELGTLEDDLIRRDFTINAMAEDEDGNIIDLFKGMFHLQKRVLVAPQDPNVMLMDDPLRALRALRFALTKDLAIEAKLQHAMKNPDLIFKMQEVVSQERIQAELNKMFKHDPIKTMQWLVTYDTFHMKGLLTVAFANGWWVEMTNKKK